MCVRARRRADPNGRFTRGNKKKKDEPWDLSNSEPPYMLEYDITLSFFGLKDDLHRPCAKTSEVMSIVPIFSDRRSFAILCVWLLFGDFSRDSDLFHIFFEAEFGRFEVSFAFFLWNLTFRFCFVFGIFYRGSGNFLGVFNGLELPD